MIRYANLSDDSGVLGYEIGPGSITVYFRGGDGYVYTNASAGVEIVERMKALAEAGRGLSTFVAQVVKGRYERKFRWTP